LTFVKEISVLTFKKDLRKRDTQGRIAGHFSLVKATGEGCLAMFQRIVVSVNQRRLCAKHTIIYTNVTKQGEIVLACTSIPQVTSVCLALVLRWHTEIGYQDVSCYH
jgi:hypothetical protein